jgi:hypothetical protein
MVLGRGDTSWERRVLFCMNISYFIFSCFRHLPPVLLSASWIATI